MNPATPRLLENVLGYADRALRDSAWSTTEEAREKLESLQRAVVDARKWKPEGRERPLINDTTSLLMQCLALYRRAALPFEDPRLRGRYLQLVLAVLPYVREDLRAALDCMARPTA